MPRYVIRDPNGIEVNRVIVPADQVAAFCEPGQSYEMEAEADFMPEREARFAAAEARRYLAETDWYVIREMETGDPIPGDIRAAREEARQTASRSDE